MDLLQTFAALSLAAGALMSLLPEGGLRRTAGMVVGLVMLLCWAEGIAGLLQLEWDADAPLSILAPAGATLEEAEAAAMASLTEKMEGKP